jgi:signal transduction histidine kinase
MPTMDGYQTLNALQQDPVTCTIPFIFLTAMRDQQHIRFGLGLGADDYLTKPFTVNELINVVNIRLEKKEAIQRASDRKLTELRDSIGMALPHELLTPLNGILGLATVLLDEQTPPGAVEARDFARSIQAAALRLHRLIFNFIIYSELELIVSDPKRIAELRKGPTTTVREIVEQTARERAESSARSADLQLDLEEGTAVIAADRFRKAVEELVDNAFKFSRLGSPIVIQTRTTDRHCVTRVSDRGRGMSAEQIASIGAHMQFERRFYEQQGAGLGLIIARRLAELHGGDLTIDSIPGEQTVVQLSVPRAGLGQLGAIPAASAS